MNTATNYKILTLKWPDTKLRWGSVACGPGLGPAPPQKFWTRTVPAHHASLIVKEAIYRGIFFADGGQCAGFGATVYLFVFSLIMQLSLNAWSSVWLIHSLTGQLWCLLSTPGCQRRSRSPSRTQDWSPRTRPTKPHMHALDYQYKHITQLQVRLSNTEQFSIYRYNIVHCAKNDTTEETLSVVRVSPGSAETLVIGEMR